MLSCPTRTNNLDQMIRLLPTSPPPPKTFDVGIYVEVANSSATSDEMRRSLANKTLRIEKLRKDPLSPKNHLLTFEGVKGEFSSIHFRTVASPEDQARFDAGL